MYYYKIITDALNCKEYKVQGEANITMFSSSTYKTKTIVVRKM